MSFPIIPGSRGGIAAIAGKGSAGGGSTGGVSTDGRSTDAAAGRGSDSSGDESSDGSADVAPNATGARDPQRIRTFMGDPFSELTERAATSIACRRALQNWSSNVPDYQ